MKYLTIFILSTFIAFGFGERGLVYPISYKVLPDKSIKFIDTYFPDLEVANVFSSKGRYKVVLKGNIIVEFLFVGDWVRVSANGAVIPTTAFIDTNLKNVINKNYGDASILSISKLSAGGYRVRLNNNIEVTFDNNENIIKERTI